MIIDVAEGVVRAGVFSHGRAEALSYGEARLPDKTPEALTQAVLGLTERFSGEGHYGVTRAVVGLPVEDLSVRPLDIPFTDPSKIDEVLPMEFAEFLPVDPGETVSGAVGSREGTVLAAAVEKKTLKAYLDAIEAAGVDPFWVGPGVFSLGALTTGVLKETGAVAVTGPGWMAAFEEGRPVLATHVTGPGDLELAASYLEGLGVKAHKVYLAGPAPEGLEQALPGVETAAIELPGGLPPEAAVVSGLAVQLKAGVKGTVNFRKGEFASTREARELKKGLRTTAVLALVLVSILAADLYVRYTGLSSRARAFDSALTGEYERLFPGETAVDPLYQFEAKLTQAEREYEVLSGGAKPLETLKTLSIAGATAEGIRFEEVKGTPERVTTRGEAPAFDSANRFRDVLQGTGEFREVTLTDVKTTAEGEARFSLTAVHGGGGE